MDSVIAKLDGSVFGMLIEQEPRILISGVRAENDAELVNEMHPEFACLADDADEAAVKQITPVVRILGSPDELPLISGSDDARALTVTDDTEPSAATDMIRKCRPDTVIIQLSEHDEDEYAKVKALIKAVRSMKAGMVD